ncbi:MAG: pyridoxamine 5'-phosphate oxidase family protein [Candidatus Hinthialibacter antarcticus]|nr:pyridoxamine 5'-phosphate oxidase family protein [Candidatus Hinthialibacter antarcticus]
MASNDIRNQALSIIEEVRIFFLASVDGDKPRLRPMTRIYHDGFCIWSCSHKDTSKLKQIRSNPMVEACFLDQSNRHLRVLGAAEILDGEVDWDAIPFKRDDLPMLEDPDYILIKIFPKEVRMLNDWSLEYRDIPIHEE